MIDHSPAKPVATVLVLLTCVCLSADAATAADPFPDVPGAKVIVFKQVGDVDLRLHMFQPDDWKAGDSRPAIVFYFGGGWRNGNPNQFATQSAYLATHGMVAFCAEYRVHSKHDSTAAQSVADAKSAMRYVRSHAAELGIDPDRIAAGGGSAGGHLAAAVATLPGFNEEAEDLSVSCVPNALVLFNPAVDISAKGLGRDPDGERQQELLTRTGADVAELSPTNYVTGGLPPTIIFHGIADSTVPYAQEEAFQKKMEAAGNRCELVGYPEKDHGFFNVGRDDRESYEDTLRRTHVFFRDLGWIEGDPTVSDIP